MLFTTPEVVPVEARVINSIDALRQELRFMLAEGRRWNGVLARQFLARSIQGSNSIEGINFTVDDAISAIARDPSPDGHTPALYGFREAMTYILQLADDPNFTYHEALVRSLHYMMTSYDADASRAGRWRPGPIFVRREETGQIVYEGPPATEVPPLMRELMDQLNEKKAGTPALVHAAMAHLNLVMIHPFSDGNGRMARALQTLALVREHVLAPEFCSIEEYIGRRARQQYYDTLATVGGKSWNATGDARPFVRFCLTAHFNQAEHLRRHALRMGQVWTIAEARVKALQLPERLAYAIADAAFKFEVSNATYRQAAEVDHRQATRDLKQLVEHGLLLPSGERRGRSYKASPLMEEITKAVWAKYPVRHPIDPFEKEEV
jgi:Fic family protein